MENDGPARRALLIYVFRSPALPNLIGVSSPTLLIKLTPNQMLCFYRNIRLSIQAFHPIAATLYKSLNQLGTPNQNRLLFFGAIMADVSTAKTKPSPSFQTWKSLVSAPQVPQVLQVHDRI